MTVEQIEIYRNPEALARAAADRFRRVAHAALKAAGIFTVALSGGNTPKALYSLLEKIPIIEKSFPGIKLSSSSVTNGTFRRITLKVISASLKRYSSQR